MLLEVTSGVFSFNFFEFRRIFFFFRICLLTLNFNLFCGNLMPQLFPLLFFWKNKLGHIMGIIFQFWLCKFCICSLQNHIRKKVHIWNLWLLNKFFLPISLIFDLHLLIFLELLLHVVNQKFNLKIQKFLFFLLIDLLH